ncbi:MAG: PhzF family phenazine biosynthesis protein [Solirubrobacterales bacterium]|nr:PhzF family phenazine biosynthesis protein [Solirubrobacterales bacterium]
MRLTTVDAFTDRPFTGNPVAGVLLGAEPPDECMAVVARKECLRHGIRRTQIASATCGRPPR